MIEEMTLTLNSPITDEQWDAITDVYFEHTDRIWFKTKHDKEVEFVKRKKGRWVLHTYMPHVAYCTSCERDSPYNRRWDFCPNCGAYMKGGEDE